MGPMTEFEVVLRGYDRSAVDHLVQAVDAAAGNRNQINAAIREVGPLPMALRGYAPAQVDAWLAHCLAGQQGIDADPNPGISIPELPVVLRGYRIAETDALLATVRGALESNDAARRADALQAITHARLPIGFRAYDRAVVDAYLQRAAKALHAS